MDFGLDIGVSHQPLGFTYGPGVAGPVPEMRSLDAIRKSLKDPQCEGPDPVYAIVMDVRREKDEAELHRRNLLFGVVTYATGRLGSEPIRSQGHIHKVSSHSGWSPPELYEIWTGKAIIYMQEFAEDQPGRCYAVFAGPGDIVVVPPYWAHSTISASVNEPLTFGAWCDREYGFDYTGVRAHQGLAWLPQINDANEISWFQNPAYQPSKLEIRQARAYPELGLVAGIPIYKQLERDPAALQWVSQPALKKDVWDKIKETGNV